MEPVFLKNSNSVRPAVSRANFKLLNFSKCAEHCLVVQAISSWDSTDSSGTYRASWSQKESLSSFISGDS